MTWELKKDLAGVGDKRDRWNEFLSEHNSLWNVLNTDAFQYAVTGALYKSLDVEGTLSFSKGTVFLFACISVIFTFRN